MIHARFSPPFSDESASVTFEGLEIADAAWNILATRLLALEYDIEVWDEDEGDWIPIEEVLA